MSGTLVLGIDIGGTDTKLGVCTGDGEVRARRTVPTRGELGPEATFRRIGEAASELMETTGPVGACGVAVPGPLDVARERLLNALNLGGWTDVPIPRLLGGILGVPTVLENDANCAAWGEARAGIARGARSLVLYTLGTGVGGGIVLDGELWLGAGGRAGRLGHAVVDPDGPPCGCGQRGCLEGFASATAIARRYGGGTAEDVFEAARRGEDRALEIVGEACAALATSVACVIEIVQPEMVVLGGGVAAAGDLLLEGVRSGVRQRVSPPSLEPVRIELSRLGNDAGWIGAALWALRSIPSPASL